MLKTLKDFKKNPEKAVTTVEYSVMLVLVAIAVISTSPGIGSAVLGVFSTMVAKLTT